MVANATDNDELSIAIIVSGYLCMYIAPIIANELSHRSALREAQGIALYPSAAITPEGDPMFGLVAFW